MGSFDEQLAQPRSLGDMASETRPDMKPIYRKPDLTTVPPGNCVSSVIDVVAPLGAVSGSGIGDARSPPRPRRSL
ncbi:hypothetical protein [Nocardia donostiensis]|uniref:hypothetical protein n=1 Tax=Nocardia donostiensis TaxID=1538463 RepID=UPI0011156A89|nr:hypothetical protein [Nocardia donostiensis]